MTKLSERLSTFSRATQPIVPKELTSKSQPHEKQSLTEKEVFNINQWTTDGAGIMHYDIEHLQENQVNQTLQMLEKYNLHPVQMGKSIAVLDEVHLLKQCEKAHPEYPPIPMTENKLHNQGIPLFSKNLPILKMGENLEVDLKEILTPSRMEKLEQGVVILLGRSVATQKNLPSELNGCALHGLNLNGADTSVSRVHGYLFCHKHRLYYKDCSSYGTTVKQHKKRETKLNYFKIHHDSRSA